MLLQQSGTELLSSVSPQEQWWKVVFKPEVPKAWVQVQACCSGTGTSGRSP